MNPLPSILCLAALGLLPLAAASAADAAQLAAERGDVLEETRFARGELSGRLAEVRYTLPGSDAFSAVEIRRTRLEVEAGAAPVLSLETTAGGSRTLAVGPLVAGAAQANLVDRDGDGRFDSLVWRAPAADGSGVIETVDYDFDGQPDARRSVYEDRVETAIWLREGWHDLVGEGAARHVVIDGRDIAVRADGRGRYREANGAEP
ncbi:MAG: hypothetical protein KDK06_22825 [Gammaproteobacteria bacterium]|nr:hypothetical protein [Gammaproteobacteria bacterium]